MLRLARPLLFLAFLLSLTIVEAQQTVPTQENNAAQQSDGDSEPVAADQDDDAAEQAAEEDNADDAPVGDSPTRFIPTEQVSQDLGVSFPTDI